MTEVSVTESLDGLLLPPFNLDKITRNDKGQVILREFFTVLDLTQLPEDRQDVPVARLTQEFDGAGYLVQRTVSTTFGSEQINGRIQAMMRANGQGRLR